MSGPCILHARISQAYDKFHDGVTLSPVLILFFFLRFALCNYFNFGIFSLGPLFFSLNSSSGLDYMKYKSICRGVEYTIFGQGKVFDEDLVSEFELGNVYHDIFGDVTGLDLDCDISCRLIEKTTLFDPGHTLY